MRLVIDATSLSRTLTGIEYYTQNLILTLLKTQKNEKLTLITHGNLPSCISKFSHQYEVINIKSHSSLYAQLIGIPLALRKIDYDIIHFPAFPPSPLLSNYSITVHDANLWAHPETLSWKGKIYFSPLLKLAVKRARAIATVSEFSKTEISKYTGMGKKINNLYQFVPKKAEHIRLNEKNNIAKLKKLVGDSPYIIAVGSLEPRKNIGNLVLAMKVLWDKYQVTHNLVLVGRNAWGHEELKQKINDANLAEKIILTGYVDEEVLDSLYKYASIFAFPSIYEGFGLPIVEAMYYDIPICCSDIEVFQEVTEGKVEYFNPQHPESIARTLLRILDSNYKAL